MSRPDHSTVLDFLSFGTWVPISLSACGQGSVLTRQGTLQNVSCTFPFRTCTYMWRPSFNECKLKYSSSFMWKLAKAPVPPPPKCSLYVSPWHHMVIALLTKRLPSNGKRDGHRSLLHLKQVTVS